jgi:D-amino-acid dehydrogenase
MPSSRRPPKHVIVVGAGMVGLSTAWFLLQKGIGVTVLERRHVASGASWGNAGWVAPAHAAPLPEPAAVRTGMTGLLRPATAPIAVPLSPDVHLARFLAGFLRHSPHRRWTAGLAAMTPLNLASIPAFDALAEGGVKAEARLASPIIAGRGPGDLRGVIEELNAVRAAGQPVRFDLLRGSAVQEAEPMVDPDIAAAVRLREQRHIVPGEFMESLAEAVREAGGAIQENVLVLGVREHKDRTEVRTSQGVHTAAAVVLATGALLNRLGRRFGVRVPVQAGRGYSFSVAAERLPTEPVLFPAKRVVFGPMSGRIRVSGMMEFHAADAPLDRRRIAAIEAAARGLIRGIDWSSRSEEWVGARPCTPDGLPLIGPTLSPRVFVAGGHGMWGITQGPATGRLLAETIATGEPSPELAALHPLR